ncbi:MAG: methylmalonyl-CoA epimerase [Saprospiraceae bacterium]|nr:methylmalonyl-CoA epimerase [Saprospiraceae bacterium]
MQVKDFPLDHVGIAVKDLDRATALYEALAPVKIIAEEQVVSQKVVVRFLQQGDHKIELLQATDDNSPVARFIAKRGEGIHHLAFRVKDILAEMNRLRAEHFELLQDKPILGALNKWVFFIHPKSTGGTLVEICQPAVSTND